VSLVLLEHSDKRISLQLRDDFPHILNPNTWGFFGGGLEAGEDAVTAALREIEEELCVQLDPAKLTLVKAFQIEPHKLHYLFSYPVEKELDDASVQEGQRMGTFSAAQIQSGKIEGHTVVGPHLEMMNWLWENIESA
ncbi:MAG: NUDIX domain-containing protein, partial [Chloroflexota bacterium]